MKKDFYEIKEISYNLGLSVEQVNILIKKLNIQVIIDDHEKVSKSDYNIIISHHSIPSLRNLILKKTEFKKQKDSIKRYVILGNEITKIKKRNSFYINKLSEMYNKYFGKFDLIYDENEIAGAFILFGKVISDMKLANFCLNNDFDASILLRPIDEAINLAHYFIITKESDEGKQVLKDWFRQNQSPQNWICRNKITEFMQPHTENVKKFGEAISYTYHMKSKSIHSSYNSIMETIITKNNKGNQEMIGFEEGTFSDINRQYEIIHFFQSSILTAYQIFTFCFFESIPLIQEDIDFLNRSVIQIDKYLA